MIRLLAATLAPARFGVSRLWVSPCREYIWRHVRGQRHEPGPTDLHLAATMDWLVRSHIPHHGLSRGYRFGKGWDAPYAETTGFAIPTLINYAELTGLKEFLALAESIGHWEIDSLDSSGGARDPSGRVVAFDTGQVLQGLTALARRTGNDRYVEAARRCARWLREHQKPNGSWCEYQGKVRSYSARIASSMLEFSELEGDTATRESACRNLDFCLSLQGTNGWFRMSTLSRERIPFLHTTAYSAEAFLDGYLLTGNEEYLRACVRTADALIAHVREEGWIPGAFDDHWRPDDSFSCLTGNAQMAVVWYKLHRLLGEPRYRESARRAVAFIKSTQELSHPDPAFRGAIAGSYPIYGRYAPFTFVSWAAKFASDAFMLELACRDR